MRNSARSIGIAILLTIAFGPVGAQTPVSSEMQRLSPLIGTWDVDDVYHPTSGADIRETGVRTCGYVMQNRYVECVTRARNAAGREREYRWYFNYNAASERYETVEIFSNYPPKIVRTIRIDSTGLVWNIRTPSSFSDKIEQWSWSQLVFDGRDRAVWTGYRNFETQSPRDWAESSRETWVRRPPSH